jgi:uncharacterized protein
MKIKLHGLPRGISNISDSVQPGSVGLPEDIFREPISINLLLEDVGDLINADYQFVASCFGICDRCANEFSFKLRAEGKLLFIANSGDEFSLQDSVKYFHPDAPEIDISQDILDALMLEMPVKLLCKEDCKGLCQTCGQDLNVEPCDCKNEVIDPRWQALTGLIESDEFEG